MYEPLTPYRLPALVFTPPNPATYFSPEGLYSAMAKPTINTKPNAKAAAFSAIANGLGQLPGTLLKNYNQGYNIGAARKAAGDPNNVVQYNSDGSMTVAPLTAMQLASGQTALGVQESEAAKTKALNAKVLGYLGLDENGNPLPSGSASGMQPWQDNAKGGTGTPAPSSSSSAPADGSLPLFPTDGGNTPLPAPGSLSTFAPVSAEGVATLPAVSVDAAPQGLSLSGMTAANAVPAPTATPTAVGPTGPAPSFSPGANGGASVQTQTQPTPIPGVDTPQAAPWVPAPTPTPLFSNITAPTGPIKIQRVPEQGKQIVTSIQNGQLKTETQPIDSMFAGDRFAPNSADGSVAGPNGEKMSPVQAAQAYAKANGFVYNKFQTNPDGSVTGIGKAPRMKLSPQQQKIATDLGVKTDDITTPDEYEQRISDARAQQGVLTDQQMKQTEAADRVSDRFQSSLEYKDAVATNRLYNNFRQAYDSKANDAASDTVLLDTFTKVASYPQGRLNLGAINLVKSTIPSAQKILNVDGDGNVTGINTDYIKQHFTKGGFIPQATRDALNQAMNGMVADSEKTFMNSGRVSVARNELKSLKADPDQYIMSPFSKRPTATQTQAQPTGIQQVNSQEDYQALPPGSMYRDSNGKVARKPAPVQATPVAAGGG